MAITTSNTESALEPLRISPPTSCAWHASSRPWADIQMLCQASIATAMPRIDALKTSCPMPAANCESACAPNATRSEPAMPAAMPVAIQRPRPAMPRVAAATMPTISAASRTSRNTMSAVPNIALLRDDHAVRGLLVVLADELVLAGLERPDVDGRLAVAGNHLLDLERLALELLGRGVLVLDEEFHLLAGGNLDAVGGDLVAFEGHVEFALGGKGDGCGRQDEGKGEARHRSLQGKRGYEVK